MDTNKTPEEELAEAQVAFAAAQARLDAARARVMGGQSVTTAASNQESPIEEATETSGSLSSFTSSAQAESSASPIVEEDAPQSFGARAYAAREAQSVAAPAASDAQATGSFAAQGTPRYAQSFYGSKDHVAAGLLAIFLGWLGLHKFYLGYNTQGFIMLGVTVIGGLLTLSLAMWVVWVIAIVEGIIYLSKNQTEFDQLYVKGTREWF